MWNCIWKGNHIRLQFTENCIKIDRRNIKIGLIEWRRGQIQKLQWWSFIVKLWTVILFVLKNKTPTHLRWIKVNLNCALTVMLTIHNAIRYYAALPLILTQVIMRRCMLSMRRCILYRGCFASVGILLRTLKLLFGIGIFITSCSLSSHRRYIGFKTGEWNGHSRWLTLFAV